MKKIIASVKLAPGNRGYFDPLTGINLSLSNNIGYIREDDEVKNIRKAIKEGKIKIVGGQLPPAIIKPVVKKEQVIKPVKKEKKKAKPEPKKEKKQEVKVEPVASEIKPVEKKEEKPVVVEEPKKKLPVALPKKKDKPEENTVKDGE